jgi:hypothetical protein
MKYKGTIVLRVEAETPQDALNKIDNMIFEAEYDGVEKASSIVIKEILEPLMDAALNKNQDRHY